MGDISNIRIGNDINIKFTIDQNAGFTADQVDEVICFIMKKNSDCCKCNCCDCTSEYSLCCSHPVYNTTPYNINTRCYEGFVDSRHFLKKYIDYHNYTQKCKGSYVVYATPCMFVDTVFETLFPACAQFECGDYYLIMQYKTIANGKHNMYTYEYDDVFSLTCKNGMQGHCEIDLTEYTQPAKPIIKPEQNEDTLKIYVVSEDVWNSNPNIETLSQYSYKEYTIESNSEDVTFNTTDVNSVIIQSTVKIKQITQSNFDIPYNEYANTNKYYLYKLDIDPEYNEQHTIKIYK